VLLGLLSRPSPERLIYLTAPFADLPLFSCSSPFSPAPPPFLLLLLDPLDVPDVAEWTKMEGLYIKGSGSRACKGYVGKGGDPVAHEGFYSVRFYTPSGGCHNSGGGESPLALPAGAGRPQVTCGRPRLEAVNPLLGQGPGQFDHCRFTYGGGDVRVGVAGGGDNFRDDASMARVDLVDGTVCLQSAVSHDGRWHGCLRHNAAAFTANAGDTVCFRVARVGRGQYTVELKVAEGPWGHLTPKGEPLLPKKEGPPGGRDLRPAEGLRVTVELWTTKPSTFDISLVSDLRVGRGAAAAAAATAQRGQQKEAAPAKRNCKSDSVLFLNMHFVAAVLVTMAVVILLGTTPHH
jgi:hypothetical protein